MPTTLRALVAAAPVDTSSTYWNEMRMPTCTCGRGETDGELARPA